MPEAGCGAAEERGRGRWRTASGARAGEAACEPAQRVSTGSHGPRVVRSASVGEPGFARRAGDARRHLAPARAEAGARWVQRPWYAARREPGPI